MAVGHANENQLTDAAAVLPRPDGLINAEILNREARNLARPRDTRSTRI